MMGKFRRIHDEWLEPPADEEEVDEEMAEFWAEMNADEDRLGDK